MSREQIFEPLDQGIVERIRRLQMLAKIMDTAVRIPGTNILFGADALIGLVPVIGDAGSVLVGLYIVNEGRRLGLPASKIAKMLANLAADGVVGAVPLIGDVFDVYFKSHRRNVAIILDHLGMSPA